MFTCEQCGKEYKTKKGLTAHMKKCEVVIEEQLEDEAVVTMLEEVTAPIMDIKEVSTEGVLYAERQRMIAKLEMTIKMCYDAETKHRLEMELKELKEK